MIVDEEQSYRIKIKYRDSLRDVGLGNLACGTIFLLMSIYKSFYENDECVFLRQQGLDFGVALSILALLQFSFYFVIDQMELKKAEKVYSFLTGSTYLIGVLFFILISYGIYKGEPCGALRILSIVYIILVLLTIFLTVLVVCCILILNSET